MLEPQTQGERIPNATWFVRTGPLSRALGCSLETIRRYIQQGLLVGVQLQVIPHYTDDRIRKSTRGHWRITVDSVERLLEHAHWSDDRVRAVRRWLRTHRER